MSVPNTPTLCVSVTGDGIDLDECAAPSHYSEIQPHVSRPAVVNGPLRARGERNGSRPGQSLKCSRIPVEGQVVTDFPEHPSAHDPAGRGEARNDPVPRVILKCAEGVRLRQIY